MFSNIVLEITKHAANPSDRFEVPLPMEKVAREDQGMIVHNYYI